MADWKAKRFWQDVHVVPHEAGYVIHLDTRPVRTPGKALLVVPRQDMAQAVAAEWAAQEGVINPLGMPFTRTLNSAIEKVAPQRADVAEMLASYAESDLLCHRAASPQELVALQAQAWDPWLAWAADALGAPLTPTVGVMPQAQPPQSLENLAAEVHRMDAILLAGFHDLVALSGSLVLALAVQRGKLDPQDCWELSRIDEDWQIAQWGADDEAAAFAATKKEAFMHAARFCRMLLT